MIGGYISLQRQQILKTSVNSDVHVSNMFGQGRQMNANPRNDRNAAKIADALLNASVLKTTRTPEVLKLPTNTSIRPIPHTTALLSTPNTSIRCTTPYGISRHGFNITVCIRLIDHIEALIIVLPVV